MPYTETNSWGERNGASNLTETVFTGWLRGDEDRTGAASALRSAFAFFRRHGDRRYSPNTLMKLLAFADQLDAGHEVHDLAIVKAETPYHYNEDTEVKSGGIVGIAIVLPDSRLMLCVHVDKRVEQVGKCLLSFVKYYVDSEVTVWVHRANTTGAQFCLANGLLPWAINPSGAVQYARRAPDEDMGSVANADDYVLDDMLRQQQRRAQPERAPRVRPLYVEDDCAPDDEEDVSEYFLERDTRV